MQTCVWCASVFLFIGPFCVSVLLSATLQISTGPGRQLWPACSCTANLWASEVAWSVPPGHLMIYASRCSEDLCSEDLKKELGPWRHRMADPHFYVGSSKRTWALHQQINKELKPGQDLRNVHALLWLSEMYGIPDARVPGHPCNFPCPGTHGTALHLFLVCPWVTSLPGNACPNKCQQLREMKVWVWVDEGMGVPIQHPGSA
eukprot:scaffold95605_cov23-Tisochrysis_lutea.AAC.1